MKIKLSGLLAILCLVPGCGYHLAGQGNSLPNHIHNIAIPIFQNTTYEYGLENILTQELMDAFDRRAGIEVVRKLNEADAVLEGTIVEYRYVPTLNSQRKVTQYYINIIASVRLRDLVKDKVYWEDQRFRFNEIYKVTGGLSSVQSNRQKAWREAAEDFGERVASVLLEGF